MGKIDVGRVLAEKAPRWKKWIPRFVVSWLRKTIHEDSLNHIYDNYWQLPPQEFIHACFRDWNITYQIDGLEHLDPKGRYLFVSNHPFGGMDGLMIADCLMEHFGDVRVVVNDILMYIDPLKSLWLPVNKHGAQNSQYAKNLEQAFVGDLPILTFPAGLCSRKIDGKVTDTEWKISFLKKAYSSQREIVPIFVEGRLSTFFYRLHHLRKAVGIKFNIEMLWLPDEMFRQAGKHFRLRVGKPIPLKELQHLGSLREQTEYVRKKAYNLEKTLTKSEKPN